jgi:hypothetical protein
MVYMIQLIPTTTDLGQLIPALVYQALTDPPRQVILRDWNLGKERQRVSPPYPSVWAVPPAAARSHRRHARR